MASSSRPSASRLGQVSHALVPYVLPVALFAIGLVLLGHDLGTVLILSAVVGGVLFTAGVPGRWFAMAAAGFAAVAVTFVVTSPNRLGRFDVWLGRDTDPFGAARQSIQGRYALADGGWTGVGLGQSREKWQWLSEPHNDFIFAIIGEEPRAARDDHGARALRRPRPHLLPPRHAHLRLLRPGGDGGHHEPGSSCRR